MLMQNSGRGLLRPGFCSLNSMSTRTFSRPATFIGSLHSQNKSECAGCFPGANPPTLKSDKKVWERPPEDPSPPCRDRRLRVCPPLLWQVIACTSIPAVVGGCVCLPYCGGRWLHTRRGFQSRVGEHVASTDVDRISLLKHTTLLGACSSQPCSYFSGPVEISPNTKFTESDYMTNFIS